MLPTIENWTLYKGLYGENDGPSVWGKQSRNIYSDYNQMRAYVECSPNQPKKLNLIDLSIEQSRKL